MLSGAPPKRPSQSPLPSITICSSCKTSPSATLDLLLLLLVLFSASFLLLSSLRSLSHLLPHPQVIFILPIFLLVIPYLIIRCRPRRFRPRKCSNPRCRGLSKALEFDVQLQTEESVRSADPNVVSLWKEIDDLPWKGGQGGNNPDYECLRAELRRMAPANGRAVLLFRAKCGCPLAKLEAWAPKKVKRNKKGHSELCT